MKLDELKKLIEVFENSKLTYMEYEEDGLKVKFDKRENAPKGPVFPFPSTPMPMPGGAPAKEAKEEAPQSAKVDPKDYVTSPLIGTIHLNNPASGKAFVSIGSKVKKGDKLCVIEAMKVQNEIAAPKDGTVKDILVKDGDIVEYSQNLFVLGD